MFVVVVCGLGFCCSLTYTTTHRNSSQSPGPFLHWLWTDYLQLCHFPCSVSQRLKIRVDTRTCLALITHWHGLSNGGWKCLHPHSAVSWGRRPSLHTHLYLGTSALGCRRTAGFTGSRDSRCDSSVHLRRTSSSSSPNSDCVYLKWWKSTSFLQSCLRLRLSQPPWTLPEPCPLLQCTNLTAGSTYLQYSQMWPTHTHHKVSWHDKELTACQYD